MRLEGPNFQFLRKGAGEVLGSFLHLLQTVELHFVIFVHNLWMELTPNLWGGQMATMSKWPTGEFRFISLCHLGVIHDTPNQLCITKRVSPVLNQLLYPDVTRWICLGTTTQSQANLEALEICFNILNIRCLNTYILVCDSTGSTAFSLSVKLVMDM